MRARKEVHEVWSGLEYTAATGMIYEGMTDEAIQAITNVRNRHDGAKRNPFNEAECGHHYARAMASWSAIPALSGFNYSAVTGTFSVTSKPGTYFWSNGYSWGDVEVNAADKGAAVKISVHYGSLPLQAVEARQTGTSKLKKKVVLKEGQSQAMLVLK